MVRSSWTEAAPWMSWHGGDQHLESVHSGAQLLVQLKCLLETWCWHWRFICANIDSDQYIILLSLHKTYTHSRYIYNYVVIQIWYIQYNHRLRVYQVVHYLPAKYPTNPTGHHSNGRKNADPKEAEAQGAHVGPSVSAVPIAELEDLETHEDRHGGHLLNGTKRHPTDHRDQCSTSTSKNIPWKT